MQCCTIKRRKYGRILVWRIWQIEEICQTLIHQLTTFILLIIGCAVNKFAKLSSANLLRKGIRQTKVPPNFRLLRYGVFNELFIDRG